MGEASLLRYLIFSTNEELTVLGSRLRRLAQLGRAVRNEGHAWNAESDGNEESVGNTEIEGNMGVLEMSGSMGSGWEYGECG